MSLEEELRQYIDEVEVAYQRAMKIKLSTISPVLRKQIMDFQQIVKEHKKQAGEFKNNNQPSLNTLNSFQFLLAPNSAELKSIDDQLSRHEMSIKRERKQLTYLLKNFESTLSEAGLLNS